MIHKALKLLKQELNNYLAAGAPGQVVTLDNISQLESNASATSSANMGNRVVMTLVNLSEETALKNYPNQRVQGNTVEIRNPVVHLNLFVLFVANSSNYEDALMRLSAIVKFFQGKRMFSQDNTPDPDHIFDPGEQYRLIIDLHTPNIEEQNNLWGMLGGKQLPAVLYRVRLVEVDSAVTQISAPAIQSVTIDNPDISTGGSL